MGGGSILFLMVLMLIVGAISGMLIMAVIASNRRGNVSEAEPARCDETRQGEVKGEVVWQIVSLAIIVLAMLLLGIDMVGEFGWMKLVALLLLAGGFTAYVYNFPFHTWRGVAGEMVEVLEKEHETDGGK